MVAEHGCDTPWRALQEQIPERTCEQVVDVRVPQVFEQIIDVPKMAEQILGVLVPEAAEQSVKLPSTVSEDRIQERTAERIADIPVPQFVEELVEVSRVFPQDRIQQCFVEQTDETPEIPSLRRSLRGLSLRRKERRNRSLTSLSWR